MDKIILPIAKTELEGTELYLKNISHIREYNKHILIMSDLKDYKVLSFGIRP